VNVGTLEGRAMNMLWKLVKQYPEPKEVGLGRLSVSPYGRASFFSNEVAGRDKLLGRLLKAQLKEITSLGMILSGFEDGMYQEWWLAF
jgi:hypothetical protein